MLDLINNQAAPVPLRMAEMKKGKKDESKDTRNDQLTLRQLNMTYTMRSGSNVTFDDTWITDYELAGHV